MASPPIFIVLTAPSSSIAAVYQKQLDILKVKLNSAVNIFCASDPHGKRVGSGGGTLNALNFLVDKFGKAEILRSIVFVIHSGGDSQRSPAHTVCGKAWASLNSFSQSGIVTPLELIISELLSLLPILKPCSFLVACSDVVIHLDVKKGLEYLSIPSNSVTVFTVPEILDTAKNHGVLVCESLGSSSSLCFSKAKRYLQKPSVSQMRSSNCVLGTGTAEENALIDTGIVLFSGLATEGLVNLLDFPVIQTCCSDVCPSTQTVDEASLRLELYSDILYSLSLSDGAIGYEEYLHTIGVDPGAVVNANDPYTSALKLIWTSLKDIPLYVFVSMNGSFGHLGTTREWLELMGLSLDGGETAMSLGSSTSAPILLSQCKHIKKCELFAKLHNFKRNVHSCLLSDVNSQVRADHKLPLAGSSNSDNVRAASGICISSVVDLDSVDMQSTSMVEYCVLCGDDRDGPSTIGKHSVVSHLHGAFGSGFNISDHMIVQHVPLSLDTQSSNGVVEVIDVKSQAENRPTSFKPFSAIVLLGTNDDMKMQYSCPEATVCGHKWNLIFDDKDVGLAADDIWVDDNGGLVQNRSLWTAKLFPVFCENSRGTIDVLVSSKEQTIATNDLLFRVSTLSTEEARSLVFFVQNMGKGKIDPDTAMLWTSCLRVSMKDLIKVGSANDMLLWRCYLQNVIIHESTATSSLMPNVPLQSVVSLSMAEKGDAFMYTCDLNSQLFCRDVISHSYHIITHAYSTVLTLLSSLPFTSGGVASNPTPISSKANFNVLVNRLLIVLWCMRNCNYKKDSSSSIDGAIAALQYMIVDFFAVRGGQTTSDSTHWSLACAEPHIRSLLNSLHCVFCVDENSNVDGQVDMVIWLTLRDRVGTFDATHGCIAIMGSLCHFARSLSPDQHPRLLIIMNFLCSSPLPLPAAPFVACANAIDALKLKVTTLFAGRSATVAASSNNEDICKGLYVIGTMMFSTMFDAMSSLAVCIDERGTALLSPFMEFAMQKLVEIHITKSLDESLGDRIIDTCIYTSVDAKVDVGKKVFMAQAPARIDLMGGWSDTPPICYEFGGAVLNMAVDVSHCRPMSSAAVSITNPEIILKCWRLKSNCSLSDVRSYKNYECDEVICRNFEDVWDVENPRAKCSLLKAVIMVLGILDHPFSHSAVGAEVSLSDYLLHYFGGGIEVVSLSILPVGSGLGGSSIVAAAVVKALSSLINSSSTFKNTRIAMDDEILSFMVSKVEQVLTTGGGWQDQMGAIYGGIKLGTCMKGLPLALSVKQIPTSSQFRRLLESRLCLVYTGQQRLAKNTLMNALTKCALSSSIVKSNGDTLVQSLIYGANEAADHLDEIYNNGNEYLEESIVHDAIDELGRSINRYWALKVKMAAGSDPPFIKKLFSYLEEHSVGCSLCGAGAGGFGCILLARTVSIEALENHIVPAYNNRQECDHGIAVTVHRCRLQSVGISVTAVTAPATICSSSDSGPSEPLDEVSMMLIDTSIRNEN